jgi:uridine kinase
MDSGISTPPVIPEITTNQDTVAKRAHYSPPWADVSIIGVAGSSGSGKTTLSHAIVRELNLPWVVILSMVFSPPAADSLSLTKSAGEVVLTRAGLLL